MEKVIKILSDDNEVDERVIIWRSFNGKNNVNKK